MSEYLAETYDSWLWFAGAAMTLMAMILGFIYMVGSLLMNEKIKTWSRMELYEVFYSAVIILIAGIVINSGIISNIMIGALETGEGQRPADVWLPMKNPALLGTTLTEGEVYLDLCETDESVYDVGTWEGSPYYKVEDCHMRLAIYYLDTVFYELSDLAFTIYIDYIWTSMAAEFTINIEYLFEMAGFMTFTPWRGFFTMPNTIKAMCFDYAIKVMTLNQFQEGMIRFIAVALFPVLFVVGAMLRTLTFTRRLGGLLLGMAIALYFVYPAFYAFGALVIMDIKDTARDAWLHDPTNTHGSQNPPIANMMYATGDIPMIGGSGSVSTDDAREYYLRYRGMTNQDFMEQMEGGRTAGVGNDAGEEVSSTLAGAYDLTPNTDVPDESALARYAEAMTNARASAEGWYDRVSSTNLLGDSFVTMAYEPGGMIDMLSRLTFFSVFFSLFSILGTIAAIRSLSMTFGGDIEIAGLTRLI
ncbi:MAG: hypothetical protein ABII71_00365 [Candidatus Micrarchaeota archaeon]